jgi:DNA-binding transcriptional MerR regulator
MYAIGSFARITGVTVKALYLYERHGLLSPQRSAAGYRRYSRRDLGRMQRIIALKSLGLPLKQIAAVLRDSTRLPAVCAQQRQALGDERDRIDRAVRALDAIARDS